MERTGIFGVDYLLGFFGTTQSVINWETIMTRIHSIHILTRSIFEKGDVLGETLELRKKRKIIKFGDELFTAVPMDKSADRAEDPICPFRAFYRSGRINLPSTIPGSGSSEEFVDPDDVPVSPPTSSSIPPSEDPHPSSGSEETEAHYPYSTSITPLLLHGSSVRGPYVSDPIPEAGSYQLSSFSSYPGGGTLIYPKPTQDYVSSGSSHGIE
ncbi:hypothetical protein M422DRAFT_239795 [Sphaerobolus stellatus SS14]|nr:hypothetical protein M422DRAFT_239795 [Sphaerobolus stellatus SS14]